MPTESDEAAPLGLQQAAGQSRMDKLYHICAQQPKGTVFFQRELSQMAVADTLQELTTLLQELVDRHLMKVLTYDNEPCWTVRSRDEADKLRKLTADERLLYHHIDQAQAEGIWSKALRARTNFGPQALTKCLKSLENKQLVQSVMSVKFPNRKMYLLKHLTPSEEIAGGPWQTDGEWDMALIEAIATLVERIIQRDTCVSLPADYNDYLGLYKHDDADRSAAIVHKKAQATQPTDIEDAPVKRYKPPMPRPKIVLAHEPKYPTAASLAEEIMSKGVIKDKQIGEADMEQLLEMMVLADRLEKISRTNYRLTIRRTTEGLNGFVDAPCGTCPVFDQCYDTGEISAKNCVYFDEWLSSE